MPDGRPWTRLAAGLALLFAALNTANALNKGGDAAVFFEGGRRFLHAAPLYEGSSAADGFIGPPFQALFFAPFAALAAIQPTLARLAWYALNLVAVALAVALTGQLWSATRARLGWPRLDRLTLVALPLAAVFLPLQTNFEHQNMNALLLAAIAGATGLLTFGAPIAAGILIGFATALKAFPALFIVYLAARRLWLACTAAVVTTIVLTALPMIVYGTRGFEELVSTWIRLGRSGWPIRGNNQSLIAAIDRFTGGMDAAGVRTAGDAPAAVTIFAVFAVLLIAGLVLLLTRERRPWSIPIEMAAVTVLAILLAPIAWDHYWTMMLPALVILYDRDAAHAIGPYGRAAFWIAALLMTGLAPLTLGRHGFDLARAYAADTVAALIVYAALVTIGRRLATGADVALSAG